MSILVFLCLIALILMETYGANQFCNFANPTFQERNRPYIGGLGNWFNNISIYIPITPGDEFPLTFVATQPYWSRNTYSQSDCEFVYQLMWYILCDATLCPLLAPGLYLGALDNRAPLIQQYPQCKQTYTQTYVTPPLPGFPNQEPWIVYAESYSPLTQMNVYVDPITGLNNLEELISVRMFQQLRYYSSQGYTPSVLKPGTDIMNPWIYINSTAISSFPEPISTGFELYDNEEFPLVEYATGKFGYLLYLEEMENPKVKLSKTELIKITRNVQKLNTAQRKYGITIRPPNCF